MRRIAPYCPMNTFPIAKEYDGNRYGMKDYFFTTEYLNEININTPLGDDTEEFLYRYYNNDIIEFSVHAMIAISDVYKRQSGKSLMNKFSEMSNIPLHIRRENPDTGEEAWTTRIPGTKIEYSEA